MGQGIALPLILLGVLVLSLGVFFIIDRSKKKKQSKNQAKNKGKNTQNNKNGKQDNKSDEKITGVIRNKEQDNVAKEDVFNFMEFEKIQDDMIVAEKGDKFTMVIQCKGINYDLMSEIEQLSIEEGFITFLNTLRYPVQLFVQTRSVDLKESVNLFKQRLDGIATNFEEINEKYNVLANNINTRSEDLANVEYEKNKQLNIMEYTQDITRYVEKMSLNKKMLQRKYYVILSYYKSDINSTNNFNETELTDIAYRELYTRSQSIIGSLQACSVSGKVLESNELAELLYVSYNRDDAKLIDIKQALESGFYRLYSTSEDTFIKRRQLLLKTIQEDARAQAILALQQAIADGTIQTEQEFDQDYSEDVAAVAIQIINDTQADDEIKEQAKLIVAQNHLDNLRRANGIEVNNEGTKIDEEMPVENEQIVEKESEQEKTKKNEESN